MTHISGSIIIQGVLMNNLEKDLQKMEELHQKQIDIHFDEFLRMHLTNKTILIRHIEAFYRYSSYLHEGNVLDWGCRHAFDACLIKNHFGDSVKISGCDIEKGDFDVFFDYAGLDFSLLKSPYKLPYSGEQFDFVISSGVLEHVPNDLESIKEIYRILRPGGKFIITFLPNHYSYTEFLSSILKRAHHNRLYKRKQIKNMLLHSGFFILYAGYHQVMPALAGKESALIGRIKILNSIFKFIYKFNRIFEKIWPIYKFAANIIIVAEKRRSL